MVMDWSVASTERLWFSSAASKNEAKARTQNGGMRSFMEDNCRIAGSFYNWEMDWWWKMAWSGRGQLE